MVQNRGMPADPLATGWLCLEFVNTVDLRLSVREESLRSYADFVQWCYERGVLDAADVRRLLTEAGPLPREAASMLDATLAAREAMFGIFHATVHHQRPAAADVDLLNTLLANHVAPMQLVLADNNSLQSAWLNHRDGLDWMLGPLARSAVELLTTPAELSRVRECPGSPGKACGWLFVDRTKNRNRQWCVGRLCGNRTRAHRHYDRMRPPSTEDDGLSTVP